MKTKQKETSKSRSFRIALEVHLPDAIGQAELVLNRRWLAEGTRCETAALASLTWEALGEDDDRSTLFGARKESDLISANGPFTGRAKTRTPGIDSTVHVTSIVMHV